MDLYTLTNRNGLVAKITNLDGHLNGCGWHGMQGVTHCGSLISTRPF